MARKTWWVTLAVVVGIAAIAAGTWQSSGDVAVPVPVRASTQATAPFDTASDCFAPWPTYDAWMSHLESQRSWFDPRRYVLHRRFPRDRFDRFRASTSCSAVTYRSDGLVIEGWMLVPDAPAGTKLPVIIYNRGGNAGYSAITPQAVLHNLAPLADMGYIVLASQYRGVDPSAPAEMGVDEFGGSDVRDVLRLVELAREMPEADADNIFMFGASRGAMMTFLALREGAPVRAVAVMAGVADLARDLAADPRMEPLYRARIPGFAADPEGTLRERSVAHWPDRLPADVPVLILHGDADERVAVVQSRLLARVLTRSGHPHRLVVYEGGDHGLRSHREALFGEIGAWFARHRVAQHEHGVQ